MDDRRYITRFSLFLISQTFLMTSVFAAAFQVYELSPSLQGNAGAGWAAAQDDVSALFINPATLTTLHYNQAYIGGSEVFPNLDVSNAWARHIFHIPGIPPSDISANVSGSTRQSSLGKSSFLPDAYISWRLTPNLVAGLGVFYPYQWTTDYNGNSVLRFLAQRTSVRSVDIVPSIGYAINEAWSVGAGFQAQYMKVELSNFNGIYTGVQSLDNLIAAHTASNIKASGWDYGYTLGVLYNFDRCTHIGLSYRSSIHEHLRGHGTQYVWPTGLLPVPSLNYPFNSYTRTGLNFETPAAATLSAVQEIYAITAKATLQYNFWNSFNNLNITLPSAYENTQKTHTGWKNSWFVALGADYRVNMNWIVRGGVAYDQDPTQNNYRSPRFPDTDRYWLSLGATYLINRCFSIDGVYTHLFMKDQHINVSKASGTNYVYNITPIEENQARANYKASANVVGLALRYQF